MVKILDGIRARGGSGFYFFEPAQPAELRDKVYRIGDRIKAGEKIPSPKKIFFGLIRSCPECGQRVKRQVFREVVVPVGGVTTYAFYECSCGWSWGTILKMWLMISGKLQRPYPW